MSAIALGLSCGREITVSKVRLYPAKLVDEASKLRAQALSKMGHTSTGIGFLGSPGWAIAGALAVSALESAINNKNHQEGALTLQMAAKIWEEAKAHGELVDVRQISNIDLPEPNIWKATFKKEHIINLREMTEIQIIKTCDQFGIDQKSVIKEGGVFSGFKLLQDVIEARWSEDFIYGGEEFMAVEADGEIIHIKWADVTTYKHAAMSEA